MSFDNPERIRRLLEEKALLPDGISYQEIHERLPDIAQEELQRELIGAVTTSQKTNNGLILRYNVLKDKVSIRFFIIPQGIPTPKELIARIQGPKIIRDESTCRIDWTRTLRYAMRQTGAAGVTIDQLAIIYGRCLMLDKNLPDEGIARQTLAGYLVSDRRHHQGMQQTKDKRWLADSLFEETDLDEQRTEKFLGLSTLARVIYWHGPTDLIDLESLCLFLEVRNLFPGDTLDRDQVRLAVEEVKQFVFEKSFQPEVQTIPFEDNNSNYVIGPGPQPTFSPDKVIGPGLKPDTSNPSFTIRLTPPFYKIRLTQVNGTVIELPILDHIDIDVFS